MQSGESAGWGGMRGISARLTFSLVLLAMLACGACSAADFHTSVVYNVTFSLPGQLQNAFSIPNDPRYVVDQLWSIGPSNTPDALITPDGANQRTIAYSAFTDELYLVSRTSATESNYVIYILDPQSGANLLRTSNGPIAMLSTDGLYNGGAVGEGGIGIASLAVANDGAIYGCNMTVDACGCGPDAGANPQDSLFRLYRWADSSTNSQPLEVFAGDPAGLSVPNRWGDTLAVRGSGTNTQILVDSDDGKYIALLTPTDSSLTNFTSRWFTNKTAITPLARSLELLGTNVFAQKGKGNSLRIWQWTTNSDDHSLISSASISLSSSVGQFALDGAGEGAAIDFVGTATRPDLIAVYDLSSPTGPTRFASTNFSTSANSNPEFAGKVIFNYSFFAGKRVWALDANRGLIALLVTGPRSVTVSTAIPGHLGNAQLITAIGQALGSNNTSGMKLIYKITGMGRYGGFFLRKGKNDLDIPQYLSANELGTVLSQSVNSKNVTNAARYAVSAVSVNTSVINLTLQGLLTEKYAGAADSTNGLADPSLQSAIISSLDGGGYVQGAGYAVHGSLTLSGRKLEVGTNGPPTVSLLAPTDGRHWPAAADFTLRASASDSDGIALVEFFQDGNKLGEATSQPFTFRWTNTPAGTFGISAKATDGDGVSAFSNTNNITFQ